MALQVQYSKHTVSITANGLECKIWIGLPCHCLRALVRKRIQATWGGEWCIKDASWSFHVLKLLETWILIDPSTVYRAVQLFEETGTVCSIQGYCESPFKKLIPHDEFAILDVILDKQITSRMFSNTCCKPLALMCALQHSVYICKVQDLHKRSQH